MLKESVLNNFNQLFKGSLRYSFPYRQVGNVIKESWNSRFVVVFMALVVWELSLVDLWIVLSFCFNATMWCTLDPPPPKKVAVFLVLWFFLLLALTFLTFCIFIFFFLFWHKHYMSMRKNNAYIFYKPNIKLEIPFKCIEEEKVVTPTRDPIMTLWLLWLVFEDVWLWNNYPFWWIF